MAKKPLPLSDVFSRYTQANDQVKNRLIGLSIGEVGSRKTSFWLEAPDPIVVQSMDKGMEGVVDRVLKEHPNKRIYVAEYDWAPTSELSQDEAILLRDNFTEDFEHAIQHARTVIWDKETDVWELFRYAEFGAPNDAPRNYPALNQRFRRLINMPKATNVNFGLIEGMKSEWVSKVNPKSGAKGAVASGERIRAGFSELDGLVHIVMTHTGVSPDTWGITVGKARGPGGHEIAGQSVGNLTFQEFAQLVFPDSDEKDWV